MIGETLNTWGAAWFDFMLTALVDGAVLLIVATVVWLAVHRRASAQLSYFLFLLVIGHLALPLTLPVPASLGWLSPRDAVTRGWQRLTNRAEPLGITGQITLIEGADRERPIDLAAHADLLPRRVATDEPTVAARPELSGQAWLMLGWAAIVALLVSRFSWVQWSTMRRFRDSRPIEHDALKTDLARLGHRLGLRRAIRVEMTAAVGSPVIWGLWRPRLLLPPGLADRLPPEQLEWVLLHELAHVRRGDLWVALVQRIVQIVYFFHPAVWLANWQIDRQREFACDDAALAATDGTGRDCAAALVSVAEWACGGSPHPALGLFHSKSLLRKRVMRLADRKRGIPQPLSVLSIAFLVTFALVVLPHVRAENEPPPKGGSRKVDAAPNANAAAKDSTPSRPTDLDHGPGDEVDDLPPLEQRAAALKTIGVTGADPDDKLDEVDLRRVAVTDEVLDALAAFPELQRLNLSESGIRDEQLARLPRKNLTHLDLSDTPVSNKGIEHVRSLAKLQSLSLARTAVTGRGLAPLAALTSLEELNLEKVGIADLPELPKLATLVLNKTAVGDAALAHLRKSPNLRQLDLRGTEVTDQGLLSLQGLSKLTTLRLDDTRVGDAGIKTIGRLPDIKVLTLGNTRITDASAESIARWTDMTFLNVRRTALSQAGVKQFANLRKLSVLNLAGTKITDAVLLALDEMDDLAELDLADTPITDAGLTYLQDLRSLRTLNLSGTRIDGSRLEALQALPRLTTLNVQGTRVSALDVFRTLPQTNRSVVRILAALDEKTDFDFRDQPLSDVLEYAQQRHDIPIQLDHKSLADAGVGSDKPITMKEMGHTLRETLESMLNPLGLTFAIRHEVLLIAAKPLPDKVSDLPVVPAGQRLSPKLAEAFMQRTDLKFAEWPLARVIEFLAKKHNIDLQLDPASLAKAGIGSDVPITRYIKGITLKSGLELIFDDLDLTCVAEGEKVIIRNKADQ